MLTADYFASDYFAARAAFHAFPAALTLAATVEFGTIRPATLLRRLRAENRLHHYGACRVGDASRIRAALRDALAPRNPAWRAAVIAGGRQIFTQLRAVLAEPLQQAGASHAILR